MNEYTWSELDGGEITISMGGHTYHPLAGPEESAGGWWWTPGYDETGKNWNMYFERTGLGLTEAFRLDNVQEAVL